MCQDRSSAAVGPLVAAELFGVTRGRVRADSSARMKRRRIMAQPSSSSTDSARASTSDVAVASAIGVADAKDCGYFLELFAGAGGLSSAVQKLGLPIRQALDIAGGSDVGFADLLVDATFQTLCCRKMGTRSVAPRRAAV